MVNKFNIKLDSAIFVSPFLSDIHGKVWQINLVNKTFYKTSFDFEKLRQLIPVSYVLYSDTDPYVKKKYFLEFAKKMKSSIITIKNGGHLNSQAGFVNFSLVLELCKTRLTQKIYQYGKN